jgi:hypothetical protein
VPSGYTDPYVSTELLTNAFQNVSEITLPCCSLQYVSLSFLHCGQSKHADIWAPTPTLSPILTDVTFGPLATTWPIISIFSVSRFLENQRKSILPWPTTKGQCLFPHPPVAVFTSEPHTPHAMIFTSIS